MLYFRNLPFTPETDQIIYVENEFSKEVNDLIHSCYGTLCRNAEKAGMEFIYLPLLQHSEQIRYCIPSLRSYSNRVRKTIKSDWILQFLDNQAQRDHIKPSTIRFKEMDGDKFVFYCQTINGESDLYSNDLPTLACETDKANEIVDNDCRFSIAAEVGTSHDEAFYDDVDKVIKDLEETVRKLKLRGITTAAIHEIIDNQEPLSRMYITYRNEITLPDYGCFNGQDIKMSRIAKALYFLFLRHPEGIRLKELCNHKDELIDIYKKLKGTYDAKKHLHTVLELTNPLSNSVHEKLSMIRAAFVKFMDDSIAKNYYVTGKAGDLYKVKLDPALLHWQTEEEYIQDLEDY